MTPEEAPDADPGGDFLHQKCCSRILSWPTYCLQDKLFPLIKKESRDLRKSSPIGAHPSSPPAQDTAPPGSVPVPVSLTQQGLRQPSSLASWAFLPLPELAWVQAVWTLLGACFSNTNQHIQSPHDHLLWDLTAWATVPLTVSPQGPRPDIRDSLWAHGCHSNQLIQSLLLQPHPFLATEATARLWPMHLLSPSATFHPPPPLPWCLLCLWNHCSRPLPGFLLILHTSEARAQ